jgi:hypothetical protein
VQGTPQHLGEDGGVGVTGVGGDRVAQLGERLPERRWRLGRGEPDAGRAAEHPVVDRRVGVGEPDVGRGGRAHRVVGPLRPRPGELLGELGEPALGDDRDDGVLAGEVRVQHRLAELDELGQPPCGHRRPALGFGQVTRGLHDQLVPLRALALPLAHSRI